eukprot:s2010_g10.t1
MASAYVASCAVGSTSFELPRSLDTRLMRLTWLTWLGRCTSQGPVLRYHRGAETCTVELSRTQFVSSIHSSLFPSGKDDDMKD